MRVATHLGIDRDLCGAPGEIGDGTANASLVTTPAMAVDERGLIHGGFVFGLADYAAMLAVNDPNVVLGSAETRFLVPCVVGDRLVAHATVESIAGKKRVCRVAVQRDGVDVMTGVFTCFVLERHVLEAR
jgi:acyl-coenzyme A thioesterase PaaI-like protein